MNLFLLNLQFNLLFLQFQLIIANIWVKQKKKKNNVEDFHYLAPFTVPFINQIPQQPQIQISKQQKIWK